MLAIETLLGALTGYFTNDIAIRQLFAENGVVVRERTQFTELIVEVLTTQIIDEKTVAALAENPEMMTAIMRFLRDLLGEELPYALSDLSLADLDEDRALAEMLDARLRALDLDTVALNVPFLHKKIDAVLQTPDFQQGLAVALKNLACLTPRQLGVELVCAHWQERLRAMPEADWQKLCDRLSAAALEAIRNTFVSMPSLCLKDILGLDGKAALTLLTSLLLAHQPSQLAGWLDVLKNQKLQEHFYIFSEQVLRELVEKHLPSVLETVYPLLSEDREWIETIFLESIGECDAASPFFRDVVQDYLRGRFATAEGEEDWLTVLYHKFMEPEMLQDLSERIVQYLLSWIVWEIDQWRRAGLDSAQSMQRLQDRIAHWRPLLVRVLDAFLSRPLAESRLLDSGVEALLKGGFRYLSTHLSATQLADHLRLSDAQLDRALADSLLNISRQEKIIRGLTTFWREKGEAWLASQDIGGETIRGLLEKMVHWFYHEPIARLICRSKEQIPYEQLGEWMRGNIFSSLRPYLGRLTKAQLDALSHQEMRELVLDMIGREMRPLAYLGGGIGAVAGLATGAAMEMSGLSPDPDQIALLMAARTGMYGVVGYGTNVMAVYGLFRPYKKTLGLQGLMSKNQTRFSHKMKDLAASYIINESIWSTEVGQFSKKVNAHFPDLVHHALQLLAEKRDQEWMPLAKEILLPHAGAWVYASLDKPEIAGWLQKMMARTLAEQDLSAAAKWVDMAAIYRRTLDRLAVSEAADGRISAGLIDALEGVSADEWKERGNQLLAQIVLPADQRIYEALWEKLLPYYKGLPELLLENKEALIDLIDGLMRKRLPFTLQMGYQLAGGKRYLAAVLEILVGRKLPAYLFKRETRIGEAVVDWMMTELAGKSMMNIGVSLSETEGRWMQDVCAALAQAPLQQFILTLFKGLLSVSEDTASRVVAAVAAFGRHWLSLFFEPEDRACLSESLELLSWQVLPGRLEPAIIAGCEGVFEDLSFDRALSLEEGTIWRQLIQALTFDEAEEQVLSCVSGKLWQTVDPVFWNCLVREGRDLLLLIDVPGLVEERINGLSPALLENLMRGIAQPYFTRVERMGWLGAVVAIPATVVSRLLGGF